VRLRSLLAGISLLVFLGSLPPALASNGPAKVAAAPDTGTRAEVEPGVRETVLGNGLKVLTKEVHAGPVVTVWTWYKVGSRNERPGATGISHLVEHMMFRATASLKTGEIDHLVQRAGGRHNAFTSFDHTAYHITLPSEHLETALRIEAERMLNCLLDSAELAREKGVVLSELQGRQNNPEELLEDVTRSVAFRAHPYRFPIIGWKTDVQALTQETVRDHYRTYYQPNNAVLVIVGDFQTDRLLALVEKYFGAIPAGPPPPPVVSQEPPQQGERRILLKEAGATAHLQFFYHLPPARDPDLYPLEVVDAILTEGQSSRLHRALEETELVASQGSYLSRRRDAGWIAFYLTARDGMPHEKIERAFSETLEQVRGELVSDFELQKAINQVRANLTFAHGSVSGLARVIGSLEMTVGHRELGQYLDRIRQVTAADVQRVARQYLSTDNRTVGWFVPQTDKGTRTSPAPTPRHEANRHGNLLEAFPGGSPAPAQMGSLGTGQGGRVVRTMLPNGLTLIAAENRVVKSIAIKGYVLAGPIQDPEEKAGLAFLTADLLSRGTPALSADALADRLEFLGASATIQAEHQTVGITAQMLSEHFDTVLDALADCLRNPLFPAPDVPKAIGRLKSRLIRDAADATDRAHRELFARVFPPGHPLHRHPRGLIPNLDRITREDLLRFHQQYYGPDRTVLVIVGDLSPEQALTSVERAFGSWARSSGSVEDSLPPMPPVAASARHTVVLPGKAEAIVMLGGNGITRNHPDYYPAFLATRILGGGLGSRLMQVLREREGMTYGVYSYFHPFRSERPWIIQLQVDPASVDRAILAALAEAAKLRDGGVTGEELEEAKASAVGSLALSMEDQMGQAFVLRDTELFDLSLDFPQRFQEAIRAVTLEQVHAAARTYLHPDRLIQIVVTPPRP
jgi:zinc protease